MSNSAVALTASGEHDSGAGGRLFLSFSAASALVMLGVILAWVLVKRDAGEEGLAVRDLSLEALPTAALVRSGGGITTLLDQAEVAFAAGRIVEPRFDNALYFYRAALEQAPSDPAVLAGVERVTKWLGGQSELALESGEFDQAAAFAARIVELRPSDPTASERFDRTTRMRELAQQAQRRRDQGELAQAAQSWRALLALDAENRIARAGLRAAATGLVEAGVAAATAGRTETAQQLLGAARSADASLPGIAALAAQLESLEGASREQAREAALTAIRASIQTGALLDAADSAADGDSVVDADAFRLLDAYAAEHPTDPGLEPLRANAAAALLELGRNALAAEDFPRVERVLERARDRGLAAGDHERLASDLAYRRYLADFARGDWTLRAISDLVVLERVAPEYPSRATRTSDGWVDFEFTVAPDGSVRDILLVEATARVFVAPGRDALNRWRFEPPRVGGRAVPARVVVRFAFRA